MFISSWLGRSVVRSSKKVHPRDAGFTLIEIMVLVVIIGILVALIVPKIMGRPNEACATTAEHDVGTLSSIQALSLRYCRYPTTEQGINALVEKPTSEPVPQNWKAGGYLYNMTKDPWGNAY